MSVIKDFQATPLIFKPNAYLRDFTVTYTLTERECIKMNIENIHDNQQNLFKQLTMFNFKNLDTNNKMEILRELEKEVFKEV